MIELITIKNEDEQYISDLVDGDCNSIFTNNIRRIMSFKTFKDAEVFASKYLNNTETYEIINLKIKFKLDETTLKTINF